MHTNVVECVLFIMLVSAPDPHVTPTRKRVWYLTSEFGVRKLSCDIKVVRLRTARACADRQTGYRRQQIGTKSHDCQVELHNKRSHADSAQPGNRTLDTRTSFMLGSREGLGPRLAHNVLDVTLLSAHQCQNLYLSYVLMWE